MHHHLVFLSAGLPAKRSGARHDLHFRHKMKSRKQPSHSKMWWCSAVPSSVIRSPFKVSPYTIGVATWRVVARMERPTNLEFSIYFTRPPARCAPQASGPTGRPDCASFLCTVTRWKRRRFQYSPRVDERCMRNRTKVSWFCIASTTCDCDHRKTRTGVTCTQPNALVYFRLT